ncbi:MAG: hypothetical protein H0X03_05685 [Nitrosopumilus sp.]|nr:hypothetical protein [Nitrosopumilus sp.]
MSNKVEKMEDPLRFPEIVEHICHNLSLNDILNLELVCKEKCETIRKY